MKNVIPVICMLIIMGVTFGGLSYFYPPKDVYLAHVLKKSDRLPTITK